MYFIVKAVLRSLLLPPAGPLILAVIGALLAWRRRRGGGTLLAAGLASLWLFSTPIVADAVSRLAEHYPALDLSRPTGAQAIVILGGGGLRTFAPEYLGPEADFGLLERLSYGAFVARHTGLPILVSGAPQEALAMRTSLARDFGTATRWMDDQSRDTYENARFSARMLVPEGITRIILVTSSTHLFRALHEYQDAGFDVVPAPVGVWAQRELGALRWVPSPAALMRSNLAVYELIGEPVRRLQAALKLRERFDKKAAGAAVD
ncbi:MAG: YdcF family protein, partial [Steroidobacteraceae bacterium]|jgi:uncharacterized SAM-binding protein YcdF (DUF218 family)